jgi:hypothetical protein
MAGAPSGGPKPSALVQGDQRRNVITVRVTTDARTEGFKKELDSAYGLIQKADSARQALRNEEEPFALAVQEWLKGIKQHNPSALI